MVLAPGIDRAGPGHLGDVTTATAHAHAHRAARSDGAVWLGRVGLVGRGVLYLAIGLLAVRIATGDATQSTSKQGALVAIVHQPGGRILLIGTAVGLVAYALWCLAKSLLVHEDSDAKAWGKRAGYVGRAVIYGTAFATAVSILRAKPQSNDSAQQHGWTATIMGWPGGRVLVGLGGLALLGAAGWNLYRALAKKFEDHLDTGSMSSRTQSGVRGAAYGGLVGRAVAFAAVAWFVIRAAVEFSASEPLGLDESLRALQAESFGPMVIIVVGIGLALFGIFSFFEARYRELPD